MTGVSVASRCPEVVLLGVQRQAELGCKCLQKLRGIGKYSGEMAEWLAAQGQGQSLWSEWSRLSCGR